jgi:hypothetical protein
VDRYLRDGALVHLPLHPNQHAYQAGKSTETALHQLVVRVDRVLEQQDIALGVFLDIEGAFNNTSYDSITAALDKHGVSPTNVRWIRATLEGRRTTATQEESPGVLRWPVVVHKVAYYHPYYGAWW